MFIREFLIKLEDLNLPKGQFYILRGSTLLPYGLRNQTNDIDLCVSNELKKMVKQKKINLMEKE